MPFFECVVTRTSEGTFYVDAPSYDDARLMADEIAEDFLDGVPDWDIAIDVDPVDAIPAKSEYWADDEDGNWAWTDEPITVWKTGPLPQCEGQEAFDV